MVTMLHKNVSANDVLQKFRADDFDLNDASRSGRPIYGDNNEIKVLLVKSTLHVRRDCRNIEHPSFKRSRPPEEAGYFGFS